MNYLSKNELYEVAENMENQLSAKVLLDALLQAMDSNDLQENLEYIDRMHNTCLFNNEENEV